MEKSFENYLKGTSSDGKSFKATRLGEIAFENYFKGKSSYRRSFENYLEGTSLDKKIIRELSQRNKLE